MFPAKQPNLLAYGGDYNPEQWPESVWVEDMRLMREAGVNLVSVGVFAWAWLQPTERRYDFRRLDRIMDLLAANGIRACLATATASPPAWLAARYPDVRAVDADGRTYHHGSRQYYSPCSPAYRRFAAELVRRLAARYARHPALALWHINNEYGNHIQECHSPAAVRAFRAWLKRKYGTLAALNAAWGTLFWSQAYSAWREVDTPRRTPFTPNPTQQLDYKRFMSDALRELCVMERDVLRAANPAVPVTTNLMGFHKPVDGFRWGTELDYVSWNSYPDPAPGARGEIAGAAGHDLTRSLRKDRPFLLMEQAAAWVNWPPSTATKPPGLLRLWTMQAIARGADGAMFFQWRASRYGAEKYMSGLVSHVPAEQSRIFGEVRQAGADLATLAPVAGSRVTSRVAIVFDWAAWWALELEAKPARFDYLGAVRAIHRYFYERNIAVDFVAPEETLTRYRLVIAPQLYLLTTTAAENLTRFVEAGGTLLVTAFSGIVDENEQVVLGGYPARLRQLLGLWVEEWAPYPGGRTNAVRFRDARGKTFGCGEWCEVIRLEGARSRAVFTDDFFAGRAAITSHEFGAGTAYYVGTVLDDAGRERLLSTVVASADVKPLWSAPPGVEMTWRAGRKEHYLFALNHGTTAKKWRLPEGARDTLISDGRQRGRLFELPPRGVAVWRFDASAVLSADGSLALA